MSYNINLSDLDREGPRSLTQQLVERFASRALFAVVGVMAFALWFAAASVGWFTWSLSRDLPDRQGLRRIGTMAQKEIARLVFFDVRTFDRVMRAAFCCL